MKKKHAKLVKSCPEIVITGGPCSGKTTGMAYLKQELEDMGFMVFIIPEVATMFLPSIKNYSKIKIRDQKKYFEIQKLIIRTQMSLREHFHFLASLFPNRKKVVLSDRGYEDQKAYTPKKFHKKLLRETGLNISTARDSYDGVMCLVTTANGAEEYYTLENNDARSETPRQARKLDIKTQNAWVGSEHLKVIDNSTNFKMKLKRVLQSTTRILGARTARNREKIPSKMFTKF